ncbi:MAG: alpha/beta hydrolase [Alphaproteobacteria bacterium]|nr:alpha/beta hydrolase [Alphaproteobacteria bacterium]
MSTIDDIRVRPKAFARDALPSSRRHIPYGPQRRQQLDLYLPRKGAVRATILYLYGGGWVSGARWYYWLFGRAMAARGYAVVVADYHLYPTAKFPAFVEDAALALKWTRENASKWGGSSSKIFVMGHSAGAHSSALLALDPRYLRAHGLEPAMIKGVIGLAGPYTLDPLKWPGVKDIFVASAAEPHGARPIKLARNGAPPMLLLHGARDRIVKSDASVNLTSALTSAGSKADAKIYPSIGHFEIFAAYLWGWRWRASVLKDTEAFIEAQLEA